MAGAQQTESPVCTPIGSRFSIEQTITTLSSRSRITSSSNSPQPSTDSSTSTCEIGLSAEAAGDDRLELLGRAREAAAVAAERERRAGSRPAAAARRRSPARASSGVRTITERGTRRPTEAIACPNASRSSAVWMAFAEAPISSISSSASTPARSSSIARLSAVCPPSVGSSASGRSRRSTAGHALEVERLEVGRVRPVGVGHDRGRVGVDEHRAVALFAQHLERLHARVVELAGLADHDRAGADDRDRVEIVAARHQPLPPARAAQASTNSASFSRASCGPGEASGWNCMLQTGRSRSRRPSTVPS